MWRPYLVTTEAAGFSAAIDGEAAAAPMEALVAFVREMAAAARLEPMTPAERGRARLLAAVAARREDEKYRAVAALPARAGTIVAATLAGSGLIAAAAANGADPIAFVRQAVQEVTQAAHLPPVFGVPEYVAVGVATEVTVEGVVASIPDSATRFDLDSAAGEVRIELPDSAVLRYEDGAPVGRVALGVGTLVRVRGLREGDGPVVASVVELRREVRPLDERAPAAAPSPPRVDDAVQRPQDGDGVRESASPEAASTRSAADTATPEPVATRSPAPRPPAAAPGTSSGVETEPLPLPAPKPAPTTTAVATVTRAPATVTPTATSTSTATPKPTQAPTMTPTPTPKPVETPTPKPTATRTPTADISPAPTATAIPSDDKAEGPVVTVDLTRVE